tara:strand:+ start:2686 stop:3162 length:477 start_codon:yes stop_codon:yes gene_type:complete
MRAQIDHFLILTYLVIIKEKGVFMSTFIPIDEYTSPIEVVFKQDTPLIEIEKFFAQGNYRHAPIVHDGKPVGLVSQRDLYRAYATNKEGTKVASDVMVEDPLCVALGTGLDTVAFKMAEKKIGSVLVVDQEGRLDGIFTSIDGFNALIEILREQMKEF